MTAGRVDPLLRRQPTAWGPLWMVVAISAAVYLPILRNEFVWDDWRMIVNNPHFGPDWFSGSAYYFRHVFFNLYQPVTCAVWAVTAAAGWTTTPAPGSGHLNPLLFHGVSLLLHAAAAGALFDLLWQITADRVAATLGALLFALHPVQVEAVAFAGVVNNPLMGALSIAALGAYWRFAHGSGQRFWWTATALFTMAVLAKPTAVVVPAVAALLEALLVRRHWSVILKGLWPWCLIAVASAAITIAVQHGPVGSHLPVWTRPVVAADSTAEQTAHVLWPARLGIDYGRPPEQVVHSAALAFSWIPPALLITAALLLFRRAPAIAVGIGLFLFALLPNSGLVPFDFQIYSSVTDRYVYLSMAGVALIVADLARRGPRPVLLLVGISTLALLTWPTELQIRTWRDGETLFLQAMRTNPRSWMAAVNLSEIETDPPTAIHWARTAIAIRPGTASAWNNLGSLLMQTGRRDEAISAFRTAAALDPSNPMFVGNYQRSIR